MKYVVTWTDRQSDGRDYEATQKRILALFANWKMPDSLKFEQFLVRVGEFGGYAVIETDKPQDLHMVTTVFAGFQFKAEPVLDVQTAVAAEMEGIAWRDRQPT